MFASWSLEVPSFDGLGDSFSARLSFGGFADIDVWGDLNWCNSCVSISLNSKIRKFFRSFTNLFTTLFIMSWDYSL